MRGGREFDDRDTSTGEPVAVFNETMATRFTGNAIGQTITLANEKTPRRVVGIVSGISTARSPDRRCLSYTCRCRRRTDPICTSTSGRVRRTRRPSSGTLSGSSYRNVAVSGVRTVDDQVADALAVPRTSALISAGAAFVAVFLALVGMYRRPHDIRRAPSTRIGHPIRPRSRSGSDRPTSDDGRCRAHIRRHRARHTRQRLHSRPDYQPSFRNERLRRESVYGLVPLLVAAASAAACIAPARRAARVDPVAVMRSE